MNILIAMILGSSNSWLLAGCLEEFGGDSNACGTGKHCGVV